VERGAAGLLTVDGVETEELTEEVAVVDPDEAGDEALDPESVLELVEERVSVTVTTLVDDTITVELPCEELGETVWEDDVGGGPVGVMASTVVL